MSRHSVRDQDIKGGTIIVDAAPGPLYIGCIFRGVRFYVAPRASTNGKPLFIACRFEECTGYIGDTDLEWTGATAVPYRGE